MISLLYLEVRKHLVIASSFGNLIGALKDILYYIQKTHPPKAAFSQCHIETNSDNQLIFKVYMGETIGEAPISFIYKYNLVLDKWFTILESKLYEIMSKSKSAIFMINDHMIYAGGSIWNYRSYQSIKVQNLKSNEVTEVGNLPEYTYYGASVYYKNNIYSWWGI
jgi:hypothetical protein